MTKNIILHYAVHVATQDKKDTTISWLISTILRGMDGRGHVLD